MNAFSYVSVSLPLKIRMGLNRIANCLPLAAEAKSRELIETHNAAQAEYDHLAALFFPWSGP
jgi:hypothetical protein